MSNISEDDGENYLVRVRAQVMTRDDSAGGWVAMGGGGLSSVSVKKIEYPNENKCEYVIIGKRIYDQTLQCKPPHPQTVLSCTITRDFTYYKVMPTFHHWQTGDKKYGLTFQAAADARAFDQGVRNALQEFLHDTLGISLPTFKPPIPTPVESPGDEDEVFMQLELPSKNNSSNSSSQDSAKTDPLSNTSVYRITNSQHKPVERFSSEPPFVSQQPSYIPQQALPLLDTGQISKDLLSKDHMKHHSNHSLARTIPTTGAVTGVPGVMGVSVVGMNTSGHHTGGDEFKKPISQQVCTFCQQPFIENNNPRGSCNFRPDPCAAFIETLQCIPCAQYIQDKCDTRPSDTRRTLWLSLLFILRYGCALLCCCGMLNVCREQCVRCGVCGAKHSAQHL